MLAHSEGFAPHIPALPLPELRTLAQPSWNPLVPPEMQKPGPCSAPAALTPPKNLRTLIFAGVTVPTEQHPSAASPLAPTSIGDRGQAVSAATVSHVTRRAPHAPPNPARADPTPAHRAQRRRSGRSRPFPSSSRLRCSGFVLRHRAPTAPPAPGQPAAPLMSPEKAAAAAGGGEVRGQCNIYSDVTFHFYEVGKRCRSRKRAARDVPAREAADTPSTTCSQLQGRFGESGAFHRTLSNTTHSQGWALRRLHHRCHLLQRTQGMAGVSRTSEEQKACPVLQEIPSQPTAHHTMGQPLRTEILRNPQQTRHTVRGTNTEMHQLVTKLPQPTCFLEEPSPVPSVEMVLSASPCTEHHPWSWSGLVRGSHRLIIILPLEMIWTSLYNMTLMPFYLLL